MASALLRRLLPMRAEPIESSLNCDPGKMHSSDRSPDSAIQPKVIENSTRFTVVDLLEGNRNIGIELGVAQGEYSAAMMKSGKFASFYGVDVYGDHHDTHEYIATLKRIGITENYKLIRALFSDAIELFDDDYFDFVYVDGYAHTGEEGGETIFEWSRKLKVGGIMAGDDYHEDWPLVIRSVHEFCRQTGFELLVTDRVDPGSQWSKYPTWVVRKTHDVRHSAPAAMVAHGKSRKYVGGSSNNPIVNLAQRALRKLRRLRGGR